MRWCYLSILLLALSAPAGAKTIPLPFQTCTVETLPTCIGGSEPGRIAIVLDAVGKDNCSVGGGSVVTHCRRLADGTFESVGDGGAGGAGIGSGSTFPGSPGTGDSFIITDDSAAGVCDSAAGTARSVCLWNGSDWVGVATTTSSQLVVDSDNDADVDGVDVQAAIDACGVGVGATAGGCHLSLPKGEINLANTLTIGTNTPVGIVFGLTIEGSGVAGGTGDPTGGTTLSWRGADAGTMIRIFGAWGLTLKNFSLIMDPDASGGNDALIGIEFAGDNGVSRTIQRTAIENISIIGSSTTAATAGSRAVRFTDPGANSAQMDFTTFRYCNFSGVNIAVEDQEGQAVANIIERSNISGTTNALLVTSGNVDVIDSIVSCTANDCVVIWINNDGGPSPPFRHTIQGNHYETGGITGSTFVKLGSGFAASPPAATTFSIASPIRILNNNVTAQCTPSPCTVKFLDALVHGLVVVRENNHSQGAGTITQTVNVTMPTNAIGSRMVYRDNRSGGVPVTFAFSGNIFPDFEPPTTQDINPSSVVVNVTGASNPCSLVQAAINPFLTGTAVVQRVKITGTANITFAQLNNRGDHRICFGIIPTTTFSGGYPVGDKDAIGSESASLILDFDNVELSYDGTGASATSVIAMLGGSYQYGFLAAGASPDQGGTVNHGVVLQGHLRIRFTADVDGSWTTGHVPGLPFASNASATTSVAVMDTGLLRSDWSNLSLFLLGHGTDHNDVGLIHSNGWGVRRGYIHARLLGTGMLFYGNSIGSIAHGYITGNDIGLVLGDPYDGSSVSSMASCTSTFCGTRAAAVHGLQVNDMVIEGNTWGNLLEFGGQTITYYGIHFENGTMNQHSVIMGAGSCSAAATDPFKPCALDSQCPSGVCEIAGGGSESRPLMVNFLGGFIGSDGGNATFDAFALGPAAIADDVSEEGYRVVVQGRMGSSLISSVPRWFSHHQNATTWMDLSQAGDFFDTTNAPANYRNIVLPAQSRCFALKAEDIICRTVGGCTKTPAVDGTNFEYATADFSTAEVGSFNFVLPAMLAELTRANVSIVWTATDAGCNGGVATDEDVCWTIDGGSFYDDDAFFGGALAGTLVAVTDKCGGASQDLMISTPVEFTHAMTSHLGLADAVVRIGRSASACAGGAADNDLAADARLLEVRFCR